MPSSSDPSSSASPYASSRLSQDEHASGGAESPRTEREPDAVDIEMLYREHYAILRGYGRRLTSNGDLVEDAIQDVFLALCDRSHDAGRLHAPRRYLLTALRRRLIDRLRATDRRRDHDEAYATDVLSFSVSEADLSQASSVTPDQRARLERALDTLSDRRREALYLRFYHGLRYREVADVMGIQHQSARNYVSEALIHLRTMLDASGPCHASGVSDGDAETGSDPDA